MIVCVDDESRQHLESVREFAKQRGLTDNLEAKLKYLGDYRWHGEKETRCTLYKDWAPHSFCFLLEYQEDGAYKRAFNGGLIFHDNGSNGMAEGSVRVSDTYKAEWGIHT